MNYFITDNGKVISEVYLKRDKLYDLEGVFGVENLFSTKRAAIFVRDIINEVKPLAFYVKVTGT